MEAQRRYLSKRQQQTRVCLRVQIDQYARLVTAIRHRCLNTDTPRMVVNAIFSQ